MATDTPRYRWEELLDSHGIRVCSFDELYRQVHSLEALHNYHRTTFYHIFWYKGEDNFHYIGYKKRIKFKNNSLLVINQNFLHKFSIQKCHGEVILFNDTFFGSTKEEIEFLNGCSLFQHDHVIIDSQNDSFKTSVESYLSLMKIKTDKGLAAELTLLRNWLHNLLIVIEREYQSQRKRFEISHKQNYMHEAQQFRILLDTYYQKQKQVGFYAKKLNLSDKKLSEIVFSAHGISVKKYINEKILKEAIRLLKNTTLTQKEIAVELGFDFTYFIKFFRKHTGITPAGYRKKDEELLNNC